MGSLCGAAKAHSPFDMKPDNVIVAATVGCEKPTHPNDRNDHQHEDQPMKHEEPKKQPSRKRSREEFEQQGRSYSVSIASDDDDGSRHDNKGNLYILAENKPSSVVCLSSEEEEC